MVRLVDTTASVVAICHSHEQFSCLIKEHLQDWSHKVFFATL